MLFKDSSRLFNNHNVSSSVLSFLFHITLVFPHTQEFFLTLISFVYRPEISFLLQAGYSFLQNGNDLFDLFEGPPFAQTYYSHKETSAATDTLLPEIFYLHSKPIVSRTNRLSLALVQTRNFTDTSL